MSTLTLLAATVVVLGLWCWVPTGAFNPRLSQCSRAALPVVSLTSNNLQGIAGRWYMSHYTVGQDPFIYNGFIYEFYSFILLPRDVNGQENRTFYVTKSTQTSPKHNTCKKEQTVGQIIGNYTFSSNYKALYYTKPVPGYYIYWFNTYVLATDFKSTVVILSEIVWNGHRVIDSTVIKVLVRDPALPPDADVVGAALNGFCEGDFLDLSSDYYVQVPNDSNLACFAAPASTGAN